MIFISPGTDEEIPTFHSRLGDLLRKNDLSEGKNFASANFHWRK